MDFPYLGELAEWVNGRWAIHVKKDVQGLPPPWSTNDTLNQYRFCNVHREHDRVTNWIRVHWREPNHTDPKLWHRLLLARLINWPPTLDYLGYPKFWSMDSFVRLLKAYRNAGNKVFTGAYIVSTNGRTMDKLEYVGWILDLASNADPVRPSLEATHAELMKLEAVGSFIAGQVVADLKHTPQLSPTVAEDWDFWAAPGPGSIRGLNRVMGLAPDARGWRNPEFSQTLTHLRDNLEYLTEWVPDYCLQDLQNCLCEFDKYQRIKEGGKVRAKYRHHEY